jgi:hypothetical protein
MLRFSFHKTIAVHEGIYHFLKYVFSMPISGDVALFLGGVNEGVIEKAQNVRGNDL